MYTIPSISKSSLLRRDARSSYALSISDFSITAFSIGGNPIRARASIFSCSVPCSVPTRSYAANESPYAWDFFGSFCLIAPAARLRGLAKPSAL